CSGTINSLLVRVVHEEVLYRRLSPLRDNHAAASTEPALSDRNPARNQALFLILWPLIQVPEEATRSPQFRPGRAAAAPREGHPVRRRGPCVLRAHGRAIR